MEVNVQIEGIPELQDRLKGIAEEFSANINIGIQQAAEYTKETIKSMIDEYGAVDTGQLRDSIDIQKEDEHSYWIGTFNWNNDARPEHAIFIEYGTLGPHTIHISMINPQPRFYQKVLASGKQFVEVQQQSPRPYFHTGIERAISELSKVIAEPLNNVK